MIIKIYLLVAIFSPEKSLVQIFSEFARSNNVRGKS